MNAICIKPHDSSERNQQVSLLRRIYAYASHIYAWLGFSREERPLAAAADPIRRTADEIPKSAYGPALRGDWLQRLSKEVSISDLLNVPAMKGTSADL